MNPDPKCNVTEPNLDRELTDQELDQAAGGIIAILIGLRSEPSEELNARTAASPGGGPH
jgi:hypothetical protein